jgi:hypothetical protein
VQDDEQRDSDEPDYSDLLEEGLNSHADSIQREKVVQMVSQALTQFKASKDALEAVKAQSPQLYQASLAMLKAMIEMASLLKLGQSEGESGQELGQNPSQPSALGQEQASLEPTPGEPGAVQQEEQNDEWHDPFPLHPDSGGERKPGHAPSASNKEGKAPPPQP